MPLEPADLKTLEAYADKCKKDVALVTNDEKPFWIYKDFPIQDKGKPVKTVLVVLINRSKVNTLLKGTLAANGTCRLQEGKVSFTPEKGKVPYGLLKKVEARFFGSKKILVPAGEVVDVAEGAEGEGEASAAVAGAGTPPGTPPQTQQTTPPPTMPGVSPARAKFMQDFEAAKPLLAQARAIVPDSLPGPLKAVLVQIPKTSAIMNEAAGKGEWPKAAEALKTMVEGATQVVEGKKKQDEGKAAAQKDYGVLKPQFEQIKAEPEAGLPQALKALRLELIAYPGRISAAANTMDWAAVQKLIVEATPKLKKFTDDKGALGLAKKKFETEDAAIKAELERALAAKPAALDQPLQQKQAALLKGKTDIAAAAAAGDWPGATEQLTKLTAEVKKFTEAKAANDAKVAFEKDFAKVKPRLDAALAIPADDLAAPLKLLQPVVSNAGDAVTAAIGEANWSQAKAALGLLKTELKKLTDGKRDQDLAVRKYAKTYAKVRAKLEAVEEGPTTPPLDALRKACLDARTATFRLAAAQTFPDANVALADLDEKAEEYLKAASEAEDAEDKKIGDAKAQALAETEEDVNAAASMPEDSTAFDAARNAVASVPGLRDSKELREILADVAAMDQDRKRAILTGAAGPMAGVAQKVDGCIMRVSHFQNENSGDAAALEVGRTLRTTLQAMKTALNGLAPSMRFVASVENSGQEGAAKAAAVIVKLQKTAKAPEVKTMLKKRYDEILKKLGPGGTELLDRELARVMGGEKEKEEYEKRYAALRPTLLKADKITTVNKTTEKAKADYVKLKTTVTAAAKREEYPKALTGLPKLKQAANTLLGVKDQDVEETAQRNDRRVKATQAFKKAESPEELEEIAESMGGEVQEGFVRQRAKGAMTQEAEASKTLAGKQNAAKLVNGAVARNVDVARGLADRLVNEEGELDIVGLYMYDPDDLAASLGVSPNSKQLANALKQLKEKPELAAKLSSMGKPDPGNPACQMIRSTLGLGPNDEVSEVHARKAALSAMLAELRQSDVGSCYATGTAIRVHDSDPGRMLDDMKQLIETGKITRDIQKDGKTVHIEVPISTGISSAALSKKAKIGANGNLAAVNGAAVDPPQHISATPPVADALEAMGIEPGKQKETVDNALGTLRTSKSQAGKTALAGLPETIPNPSDPSKKIPNKVREELLAKIPAILAEQPDPAKAKAALQAELAKLQPGDPNLAKSAEVLAAFDKYFTDADHEFTPDDILKQTALTKSGLTEADMAKRERLEAMNLKLRGLRGNDPQDPATEKFLEEINDLATVVNSKREAFGKFDEMVGSAKDSYAAQDNNRLLRAWEYSVTTLAEQGAAQVYAPEMKAATGSQVKKALDKSVAAEGGATPPAKLTKAADDLQKKFSELWDANVRTGYDASKQGAMSADGSSSKGAFCLFDKAGIDDPNKHIAVNDKQSYSKLIEGLMSKASSELLDQERDPEVIKYLKKVASEVADQAAKEAEEMTAGATQDLQGRGKTKAKEPWAVVGGNNMEPLLSTYYGEDVSAAVAKTTPADPEAMTGFLLTSGRQLLANIPDKSKLTPDTRVPMRGGPHVWSLRPGDPKVRQVLESPGDAAAFKGEERAKYDAQKETALSPELTKGLIDDILPKDWDAGWKPTLLHAANSPTPATKVDEVVKRINAYFANNPSADIKKHAGTVELNGTVAVMKNVAPPVPQADGKLAAHLDGVLKKLNLGDKEADVKAAVIASFNVAGTPPPPNVSMTMIEKSVAKVLKAKNLRPDEAAASAEVCRAQKPPATPPGLPFGDTNWGGGDHHTLFTMVRNPNTDALEMWQCNEDGSAPAKLDSAAWINGQPYEMVTDPAKIGGLV